VLTDVGPINVNVPRDRHATFDPNHQERQRCLDGVDAMVISLVAKGLTTGEVQAHLAEVYGTDVSRETISKITDRVLDELSVWQTGLGPRLSGAVHRRHNGQDPRRSGHQPARLHRRGGHRRRRTRHPRPCGSAPAAKAPNSGCRCSTEIKNRGTEDVCIVVCDGLKGLPAPIETTWPLAVVQTCVLHLVRNTFRLASRADWDAIARDL